MNLIRLEELSLMSNAVLTPQLNNWPCIQSPNLEDTNCQKHRDSFSEQSDKKFHKEWRKQQKKILKNIPSNAVLLSIKEMV
ncbi:hypothetical protein KTI56_07140 [Acinetobacter pittii]|uniref:hypothetical protein n=1 Tax=Acinetobacter pittii TaxID=48296 RepID=UPI00083DD6BD|nr:hypothetical protein [Acinetobacter pittii]MCU4431620.1 hypothetical protein [Acinetobacter pittii]MCU4533385.1 hypothetical protein [Acinetobacter pittii]ODI92916.1 hypothetical protein BFR91_12165 [Acinetobacter pittii]